MEVAKSLWGLSFVKIRAVSGPLAVEGKTTVKGYYGRIGHQERFQQTLML